MNKIVMPTGLIALAAFSVVLMGRVAGAEAEKPSWKMVHGDMVTRWAKEVSPTNVLPEYPRPAMQREQWINLNGLWEFALGKAEHKTQPERFDDHILVPFAAESALSGVKNRIHETDRLWYRRTFEIPKGWIGQRILLHFGGVDWETTVWVNGQRATHHRGGYDPFSIDISDMLNKSGPQEIVVSVWDPSDKGQQMRGKQVIHPHGFNYTGISGIWQTVWLEPVPVSHLRSIYTESNIDENFVWVIVDTAETDDAYTIEAKTFLPEDGKEKGTIPVSVEERAGRRLRLRLPDHPKTRLWSPDSPYLYDLLITLKDADGKVVDKVESYFGMRKIAVGKDTDGINRLMLNNKPLFHYGFLDQGWWPDGLYTAPTDEALQYDIKSAKRLGANMVRKHVKIEPQRFYYWCDRLGILVWQDMPSGTNGSESMKHQYEVETRRNIESMRCHPSIVMWVLFNEGWGQHEAPRHAKWVKHYDPTRLVNHASGWADRGEYGDVRDIHIYDGGPGVAPIKGKRAIVLGEFGGIGWSVKGHGWRPELGHGHGGKREGEPDLTDAYLRLIRKLPAMKRLGLSAAVYTQIADQEIETNGVMTYDREVLKFDARKVAAETKKLYQAPPRVKMIVATSEVQPQMWSYSTVQPTEDWYKAGFDASTWKKGPGPFGDFHPTFPTLIVMPRTKWSSKDIWIRRTFELAGTDLASPYLLIHHDEDTEVYLNGKRILQRHGTTNYYSWIPMDEQMVKVLRQGTNTIAVHCHNVHHPQCIDVGIIDVIPNNDNK